MRVTRTQSAIWDATQGMQLPQICSERYLLAMPPGAPQRPALFDGPLALKREFP
jgi:hypothetical protein